RGLKPETASRVASLAYPIKYAQAFNEGGVFVFDPANKSFLLEKDFTDEQPSPSLSDGPVASVAAEYPPITQDNIPDGDTAFHRQMHSPARLVLPGSEKKRNAAIDADPKLKSAVAGKQFVPVKGDDVGVEAVDNYTLRIMLMKPAPYFISMMPHQFF